MEINKELFNEGRVAMQKKSVLLIEDEKDLAECLTSLFEDWNMAVSIAFDLATVRSIIEQNHHFDLIILDENDPKKDYLNNEIIEK
jgi:DNA-binding response OmpR family regulator